MRHYRVKNFVAMKVVKSAQHYTETALDEIKLLRCVSIFPLVLFCFHFFFYSLSSFLFSLSYLLTSSFRTLHLILSLFLLTKRTKDKLAIYLTWWVQRTVILGSIFQHLYLPHPPPLFFVFLFLPSLPHTATIFLTPLPLYLCLPDI